MERNYLAKSGIRPASLGTLPYRIVLAHLEGNVCEFVTWTQVLPPGRNPYTTEGHYFDNVIDAALDYQDRCASAGVDPNG